MLFSKIYRVTRRVVSGRSKQSEGGGGKKGQKIAIILNVWPLISLVLDCMSELYHSNDFFTKTFVSLYKTRLQNFYSIDVPFKPCTIWLFLSSSKNLDRWKILPVSL